MDNSKKFSPEVREREVRMVQEQRDEYPSLWAVIESLAPKIGCRPQTLLTWFQRHEIDSGQREGVTMSESNRVKELERENKELRRANVILKLDQRQRQEVIQGKSRVRPQSPILRQPPTISGRGCR